MPGRIRPVELGVNPWRLHCLLKPLDDRLNSTSRIGCKSIEIMTTKAFNRQCNLNGFTPKSTSIYLNGFTPNSTGQIGCKSIEIMTTKFDQAGIQCTGSHTM